jgi:hypothetical protein
MQHGQRLEKPMIRLIACALCMLGLFAGTSLFADEAMTHATMTQSQKLKDCMERQKAGNVAQSKAAMKKFCKDQLRQEKATGEPADPPPAEPAHN